MILALSILIVALAGCGSPPARLNVDFAKIKDSAQAIADGMVKGDHGPLGDVTHPKIIALMGGREKMLAEVKSQMEQLAKDGYTIVSYTLETPTEYQGTAPDLAVIVPQKMRMKFTKGFITQSAFLLAVSDDSGATWKFVDGAQLTPEMVRAILPPALHQIKLPKVEAPKVE